MPENKPQKTSPKTDAMRKAREAAAAKTPAADPKPAAKKPVAKAAKKPAAKKAKK